MINVPSAKRRKLKYVVIGAVILTVLALTLLLSGINLDDLAAIHSSSPYIFAMALIGLFCLKVLIWAVPQSLLYMSAGVLFPLTWAFALCIFGVLCQLNIGFGVGRAFGQARFEGLISKYDIAKKFAEKQEKLGPAICFFMRFSPFPVGLVNIYLGSLGIKYRHYVGYSFAAQFLIMSVVIVAGYSVFEMILRFLQLQ